MINLSIDIQDGKISEFLDALPDALTGHDANEIAAEAAAEKTRDHLRALHGTRHRPGSGRSFYLRAADAVVTGATADEGKVEIDHTGLALRYYGGDVEPSGKISLITGKPIRHLAIPRQGSEAEGKTPYDFKNENLELGFGKKGTLYLGKRESGGKRISALFWLVDSTHHEEDKTVLPTHAELADAAVDALSEYVEEVNRGL